MEGFDCYTPLERPAPPPAVAQSVLMPTVNPSEREEGECDTDSSDSIADDSSSDSSDTNIKKRAVIRPRKKLVPLSAAPVVEQAARVPLAKKKYNIWTEKIREDALTETMRNFGVNRDGGAGDVRSVEWYDYTLGNRFKKDGKTNRLKRRRREDSGDGEEEEGNSMDMDYGGSGKRVCYGKKEQNKARHLADLDSPEEASLEEVAKEIARNLKETNEALIVQVTTALGREFVHGIYKETQRIEEDGGMMIRGNRRRRTSGGVFLFLVKHNDQIGEEKKREAFKPIVDSAEETSKRDEEIEELKKTLITQDSPKLRPRIDAVLNLSNPPPSPVAPTTEEDGEVAEEDADRNNNTESGPTNDHMDYN